MLGRRARADFISLADPSRGRFVSCAGDFLVIGRGIINSSSLKSTDLATGIFATAAVRADTVGDYVSKTEADMLAGDRR